MEKIFLIRLNLLLKLKLLRLPRYLSPLLPLLQRRLLQMLL